MDKANIYVCNVFSMHRSCWRCGTTVNLYVIAVLIFFWLAFSCVICCFSRVVRQSHGTGAASLFMSAWDEVFTQQMIRAFRSD